MATRWTASAWLAHAARYMQTHERQWLDEAKPPERVGELELAEIQQRAVARAGRALALYGGVILADGTGMGKTRVALALIWRFLCVHRAPAHVMLCVPARLRPMWTRALALASQGRSWAKRVHIVTHHACSHEGVDAWHAPDALPALVVIDEAHRLRNPASRRYDTVARLARHARGVICITASPVCNGIEDLGALVELFCARGWRTSKMGRLVGEDLSSSWQPRTLEMLASEVIVRRTHLALGAREIDRVLSRPRQRVERLTYEPGSHEQWVWQHLGERCKQLERALFAGRWGEGLLVELMWRRWESGVEALWRTLRRLLTWHERALAHHARAGTFIGARELRRAFDGEQEVFGFLLDEEVEQAERPDVLDIEAVARDEAILRELFERVSAAREDACSAMSGGRVHALCDYISRAQAGQKVLAFTSSVEAAEGSYDALRARLGAGVPVGLLTGRGARVTGLGRRPAQEVLERFAPIGQECQGLYTRSEQIEVLVATDCIAEGVNLQDCACVVLLDLPYSPLGVAQRVGRFVRPGSPHEEVVVVWLRPARWQDSLGMRRRLDKKALAAAQAHVGYDDLCEEIFCESRESEEDTAVSSSDSLDRLERLWRGAHAPIDRGEISLMYQCDAMGEVWGGDSCVVWVREGSEALGWRHTWWRIGGDGGVSRCASDHVAELVTWMESGDRIELVPCENATWRARIEDAVRARESELQGLWWAPNQVREGSVARGALDVLRGVPGSERVCLALATCPLGQGLERMIAEALAAKMSASEMCAWLERELRAVGVLDADSLHDTQPPRVEWLSAVFTAT